MKHAVPRIRKIIFILLVAISTGGWSLFGPNKPTESDARQDILKRIDRDAQGRIRLTSFTKTNGSKGEMFGTKIYSMDYKAEIEFTEECVWVIGMFGMQAGFKTRPHYPKPTPEQFYKMSQNPGMYVKHGESKTIIGSILYSMTDNSWSLKGIKVKLRK